MSNLINPVAEKVNLEGYTLIIPSVSVGNIGQLTVDLLISSYKMKKVAIIWHPAVVPCVGINPISEDSNEICTACELFVANDRKLAVIQLRSTLEFEFALDFFNQLQQEVSQWNVKNVVILTSSYAHEMHNVTLSPFLYLSNESDINKLTDARPVEPDECGKYTVHGAGFAMKLYEILSNKVKTTVLIKYTSEGDNRPDATQMLFLTVKFLNLNLDDVITPTSWKFAFGNPPPIDIY